MPPCIIQGGTSVKPTRYCRPVAVGLPCLSGSWSGMKWSVPLRSSTANFGTFFLEPTWGACRSTLLRHGKGLARRKEKRCVMWQCA